MKPKFALVWWNDSHHSIRDFDEAERHSAVRFITGGWIVKSDDVGITLACSYAPPEENENFPMDRFRIEVFIRRGMIERVKEVRLR